jgi:hypothetical protein
VPADGSDEQAAITAAEYSPSAASVRAFRVLRVNFIWVSPGPAVSETWRADHRKGHFCIGNGIKKIGTLSSTSLN